MKDQCGCKLQYFTFKETRAEFANRIELDDYRGLRPHVVVSAVVFTLIHLITELWADSDVQL